ncbi:MAG: tRNA pseudouridine synthase [Pseudomonadota bacterium]|jgi:tRNA pseudouridine38-40 synthase
MRRIAIGVEYDGSAFAGWQSQHGLATVQAAVEAALTRVADHPVQVTAAGRTDAGVHGRGQVAHFDTEARRDPRSWVLGANTHLPPGVALRWAREVPAHFHARYTAQWRAYRYCILNRSSRSALAARQVGFYHRPLDLSLMQAAAPLLVGEHDFSAFRAAECQSRTPVRRLLALDVVRRGDFLIIQAIANAFLHHMVRNLVGLLAAVGQGVHPPAFAAEVLAGRDRRANAATAPAAGLVFWRVGYPAVFGLPDDSVMMQGPAGCPADLMDQEAPHVVV